LLDVGHEGKGGGRGNLQWPEKIGPFEGRKMPLLGQRGIKSGNAVG